MTKRKANKYWRRYHYPNPSSGRSKRRAAAERDMTYGWVANDS